VDPKGRESGITGKMRSKMLNVPYCGKYESSSFEHNNR
jgi:hypothetical protein